MHIKTILNQITNYKSFVFGKASLIDSEVIGRLVFEVEIVPRKNGRMICSGCGCEASGYDRANEPRRFEFVPLWGIAVYFLYRMRRVECV